MYYVLYLASLCKRRHWPDPLYESYPITSSPPTTTTTTTTTKPVTNPGYTCVVRVNNREYQTDIIHESESLARENAAMRAYLICRNFSVNDGMYPAGHDHGGVVQGVPVAIGTGRGATSITSNGGGNGKGRYSLSSSGMSVSSGSGGSRSGGSSGGSSPEERFYVDGFGRG